jgi:hypothetical protein
MNIINLVKGMLMPIYLQQKGNRSHFYQYLEKQNKNAIDEFAKIESELIHKSENEIVATLVFLMQRICLFDCKILNEFIASNYGNTYYNDFCMPLEKLQEQIKKLTVKCRKKNQIEMAIISEIILHITSHSHVMFRSVVSGKKHEVTTSFRNPIRKSQREELQYKPFHKRILTPLIHMFRFLSDIQKGKNRTNALITTQLRGESCEIFAHINNHIISDPEFTRDDAFESNLFELFCYITTIVVSSDKVLYQSLDEFENANKYTPYSSFNAYRRAVINNLIAKGERVNKNFNSQKIIQTLFDKMFFVNIKAFITILGLQSEGEHS